jgi:hypothetical protein
LALRIGGSYLWSEGSGGFWGNSVILPISSTFLISSRGSSSLETGIGGAFYFGKGLPNTSLGLILGFREHGMNNKNRFVRIAAIPTILFWDELRFLPTVGISFGKGY